MVALTMFIGVALLATSGWWLARGVMLPRMRMESHLAQLEGYGVEAGYAAGESDELALERTRPLESLAGRVGRATARLFPSLPQLDRAALNAAGIYTKDPEVVNGYRLLAGASGATLALLYGVVLAGKLSPLLALLVAVVGVMGWDLPAFLIRRRGRDRLNMVDRQMPDLIDLLVASVEAGMGVGASIALLADRFDGPLGEELRLVLNQQRLGTSSAAALTAFSERVDTPGVRAFSRTLVRAEAMGGSIGPVLRNLATDARRRRRQAASERAAKVPLKLLFPLIGLIFPALFVVLMYPAAYTIMHTFGN
jgi:tight adherence protein C